MKKRIACISLSLLLSLSLIALPPAKAHAAAAEVVIGGISVAAGTAGTAFTGSLAGLGGAAVAAALAALGVGTQINAWENNVSFGVQFEAECNRIWQALPASAKENVIVQGGFACGVEFLQWVFQVSSRDDFFVGAAINQQAALGSFTSLTAHGDSISLADLATALGVPTVSYVGNFSPSSGFRNQPMTDFKVYKAVDFSVLAGDILVPIASLGCTTLSLSQFYNKVTGAYQNVEFTFSGLSDLTFSFAPPERITPAYVVSFALGGTYCMSVLYQDFSARDTWRLILGDAVATDAGLLLGQDVWAPSMDDDLNINGIDAINNSLDDVIARLRDICDVIDGKLVLNPAQAGTITDVIADTSVLTQDQISLPDDNKPDKPPKPPRPKPDDFPDISLPDLLFRTKFPFCLPWDIYSLFAGFLAEAEAPRWEIPVSIPSLGYQDVIVLDLSQFEHVAEIGRFFIGAIFVLGLILVTRKLIGA